MDASQACTKIANGGVPLNLVEQAGEHVDVNRVLSELLGSNTNNVSVSAWILMTLEISVFDSTLGQ